MLNRFIHNNRGVSEIISGLILILIVASAGVVVYAYSVGAFSSSSGFFQQQTQQNEEQARERFQIIRVWCGTSNQFNLTVLNYGKIDVTIDAVYINNVAVTTFLSGRGSIIGVGELVGVKCTSPVVIQLGSVYEIAVITERGDRNAVNWQA
jgi:hypothetical protein